MPRLHQYKSRDNCYVLTSIRGKVITFQLTPEGERKLREVGVAPDQNFPRALLLDLCRTGEAFTGGSGLSESLTESINQLELDFTQDPDPETLFPACDDCGSLDDLHLSIVREQGSLAAKLQCPHCRDVTSHMLDTCIPSPLVTLTVYGRLFQSKQASIRYEGVGRLENLLSSKFESKWEDLRRLRRSSQRALFETGVAGELELSAAQRKTQLNNQ
jgi:hypothetical protein